MNDIFQKTNRSLSIVIFLVSFVYLFLGIIQVFLSIFAMASSVLSGFPAIGLTSLLLSTSFITTKFILLLPPSLAMLPIFLTGIFNLVIAYGLRKRRLYGLILATILFALYLLLPTLSFGYFGLRILMNPSNMVQAGIVIFLWVNKKHFN